ncbi:MAG: O-antigen ligase family protein [Bacteroidales bacterium]|nr:O-antigen ligase family protein [Bacteroidales bacterium]
MTEKIKLRWLYVICAIFIAINTYLIINQHYWSFLIPIALIIILLYLFSIDKVILLITFLTPLAINIRDIDFGVGISIPTEPLMFGVLIIFILKILYRNNYDIRILKHPITIAIILNLIWIFITSITSEIPFVSFKFLISRLWFVIPFYFIGILIFRKFSNIKLFYWLYIIPLLIVIFYTIYNHSLKGFDEESGHWVMSPFYNDHTAYGAIIALYIPVFIGLSFNKQYTKTLKIASFIVLTILTSAIILSFSRAAWVSLAVAFSVYIIVLLKIKFRWIFITVLALIGFFYAFQFEILDVLEKNKQDSSANYIEHVQSISNITSDASNLERINRWQSAIRMFNERPFWGWGPGTYQFMYAPFQRSKEKTIISTNVGDMGNAHSEYIGPLAETGVLGMLSIISIVVLVIITALKVYKNAVEKEVKFLSLITLLGLITYFAHGLLNNFLDSDKASVPFWGFIAIIVTLDLYHNNKQKKIVTT